MSIKVQLKVLKFVITVKAQRYGAWMSLEASDWIRAVPVPTVAGNSIGRCVIGNYIAHGRVQLEVRVHCYLASLAGLSGTHRCTVKPHMKALPPPSFCKNLAVVCSVKRSSRWHHMFQRRTVDVYTKLAVGFSHKRGCGCRKLAIPNWGGNWICWAPCWVLNVFKKWTVLFFLVSLKSRFALIFCFICNHKHSHWWSNIWLPSRITWYFKSNVV